MTTRQDDFDRRARALHAQAVQHVPSRTLEQLRIRRTRGMSSAAVPARGARIAGWSLAAACTAVFALAIGLRQPGIEQAPAAPLATTSGPDAAAETYEAFATLDEDPDLFLWLASQDALPLAME
ncbi:MULTISPECIES: hypothetical protein [unclassified Luteimonas]|uniref:hypothetical protein n=1 Tax=unclassified Luteimonas TaxID=2629088 RepID=UPI0018F06BC9|nr:MULTISPECIES: hypothetical protein [unclassified Luteimonas]MBJ6981246.1 hypothetical protein [Luteimonas sp. MC1572]MBJ7576174.1 hypothetical protein [Luteimonas sp. MC1828]QQO02570.1 hypothetical protein JGR64_10330 [Luteimonas sp. MC1572]